MPYDCVVLAKQVPDTKRITGKAMNDDGTVNRAALPAIFNPEDLNALEMALQIKEQHGGRVTVMTMGPPMAAEILREALYRGADQTILITDRRCAGSDTLATSYILSCAVRKLGQPDLVLCGRQAIDGDTAQVGPQLAEKLGLVQITYVDQLPELTDRTIRARRGISQGWELVETRLPVLLTVTSEANTPRPPAAKKIMRYKRARTVGELQRELAEQMKDASEAERQAELAKRQEELLAQGLLIPQWGVDELQADTDWIGLAGSPTMVRRIQTIVLTAGGYKNIEPTDEGIRGLVHELIEDHAIG